MLSNSVISGAKIAPKTGFPARTNFFRHYDLCQRKAGKGRRPSWVVDMQEGGCSRKVAVEILKFSPEAAKIDQQLACGRERAEHVSRRSRVRRFERVLPRRWRSTGGATSRAADEDHRGRASRGKFEEPAWLYMRVGCRPPESYPASLDTCGPPL